MVARALRLLGVTAALGLAMPSVAHAAPAQAPPPPDPHQGYFVAVGLHYGGARVRDTQRGGWAPMAHGPHLSLRAGEAVTSWLDLGLDLGLGYGVGGDRVTLGHLTAQARWYPLPRWFVHTGAGLGASGGPDPDNDGFDRGRFGDLYVLGIGTNRYLGKKTISGGFIMSPVVKFQLGPGKDFMSTALWVGVEFSWWSGLSRNKLELSPDEAYGQSQRRKRRRKRRRRRHGESK